MATTTPHISYRSNDFPILYFCPFKSFCFSYRLFRSLQSSFMRSNCARTPSRQSGSIFLYSPVRLRIVLLFSFICSDSPCLICSTHGRSKPPNWNRARLPKRNTTSGGTSTRNWTPQSIGRKSPRRRSVIICLMDAQAHPWKNFRKSRKRKRKHLNRKRRKHISPNGSMTDIRQMDFCASTSPSGSLSTQKDLAAIQYSYLNPHFRAVVAAFVKQPCLTGELHKCNRPVCQSCFPHCSRKSARFFLCH